MLYIFWIGLAFLGGSFPFGLIVARVFCEVDPRTQGSCNVGATNVARLCGFKYGLMTLALDLGKGFVPVFLAMKFSQSTLFLSLTALAALMGHMYSVFLHGRGGKGVATTIGVFMAIAPWATLFACLGCIAGIAFSGYVSVGSLTLVGILPFLLLFSGKAGYVPLALLVFFLVYRRHRENIERLRKGEEKSWRKK